jgi:geranylgeranyl diphosphate synthase type II
MIKNKINAYAAEFEVKVAKLYEHAETEYSLIYDACRYSLLLGGKRLRPFLMNSFYKLCGGKDGDIFNFEAAIESIHTYSLIHDDLPCMDDDDMRRGKVSCHKKFGEANALLAGDALLTKAFELAADTKNIELSLVLRGIKNLAALSGADGMIGGQVVDLIYENKSADEEILKLICRLKTGALIKAACSIGCILAGANEEKTSAAESYAEKLGLAFQIVDDILDVVSTTEKLGKPVNSDREKNKSTFVSLYGIERCKEIVIELTEQAKCALSVFGESANDLKILADYLCTRDY